MAEERPKRPPERGRSRAGTPAQSREKSTSSDGGVPDVHANEKERAKNPNDAAAFDADQLDASIRTRQQQDRGEVF